MAAFLVKFDNINSHGAADRIISGEIYVEAETEDQARSIVREDLNRIIGSYCEVAVELPGGVLGDFGEYRVRLRAQEPVPAQADPVAETAAAEMAEPEADRGGIANAEQ